MDIIFNCPKCEQELEVDAAGAGSEISCPNCNETILIPQPGTQGVRSGGRDTTGDIPSRATSHAQAGGAHAPINAMATSAAAKVEMHLKVPVHSKPTESLISKPPPPLEATAKTTDKTIRVKTIRHTDCIEVGHDRYDEVVSQFLAKIGETSIINISPLTYTHVDIGSQKLLSEYAVMIVYRA